MPEAPLGWLQVLHVAQYLDCQRRVPTRRYHQRPGYTFKIIYMPEKLERDRLCDSGHTMHSSCLLIMVLATSAATFHGLQLHVLIFHRFAGGHGWAL